MRVIMPSIFLVDDHGAMVSSRLELQLPFVRVRVLQTGKERQGVSLRPG
jgi:hypothetical protein